MPVNKVLRILGKSEIPIASINLVPLEVYVNTPLILYNFKAIRKNILVIAFNNLELKFKDIFPERGDSYEETKEALKKFFAFRDEVRIIKEGVVIGEIESMKVEEYIEKKLGLKSLTESEFIEKVEKGEFSAITPFGIAFVSKMTHGISVMGLSGTPLQIYPCMFDLENYYDSGFILGEVFTENPEKFVEFGDELKAEQLKILFVDSTTLLAYHGEVYKMYDFLIKSCKGSWVSIFTPFPSAKLVQSTGRKLISEIEPNIFYFGSGTSLLIKFRK